MVAHMKVFTDKSHAVHKMQIWPRKHELEFKDMWTQFKFGLACSLPVLLGLGALELLILMSAYLGPAPSAATVVGLQIENVTWAASFGICVAAVSLVGFEIGAGTTEKGKKIAKLIMHQTLVISLVICFLIYMFNWEIVKLYTDLKNIEVYFQKISLPLVLMLFFDFFVTVLFGIIKGLAKQVDLFVPIFVSLYVFGLTSEYILCFELGYDIEGLFYGLAISWFICAFWLYYLVFHQYDWDKIA